MKSAAYLQSWKQSDFSTISFDIRPTLGWDSSNAVTATERARQGDIYVFCLLHHKDKTTIDALDLSQWTFYLLRTSIMNERAADPETDFAVLAANAVTAHLRLRRLASDD